MATDDRRARPSLRDELFRHGERFAFDQATRLLEQLYPKRRPVGEDAPPEKEVVRYRSRVDLGFPASDVARITPPESEDEPAEMLVSMMGLAGYQGPLPLWISELIGDRERRGDHALRDFLDIFNHRLVSLLFRARRTLRVALTSGPREDLEIVRLLYALLGLGQAHARRQLPFPAAALLPFTGLFLPKPRSLVGLRQVLEGYFRTRVEVRSLIGDWYRLETAQITRIGVEHGQNNALGQEAVLGRRVWEQRARIELRIGPLDYRRFQNFLPGAEGYRALEAMVRLYVADEHRISVRLVLRGAEIPEPRLTAPTNGDRDFRRLGWNSWLGMPLAADAADDDQVRVELRPPATTHSAPPATAAS